MKTYIRNIPTEFIEFDNGAVMKKERFLADLVEMATSPHYWFNCKIEGQKAEWLYIKSELEAEKNEITYKGVVEEIVFDESAPDKMLVVWRAGDMKGRFFSQLIDNIISADANYF